MLARPFDGDPDRYFWLYGGEAEGHAFGLSRVARAHGRGPLRRVGLVGALHQTAMELSRRAPEVFVYDPDVQRIAALSVRAMWANAAGLSVRTSSLPEGLDAVLAPACLLSSLMSDEHCVELLQAVADALVPGGVFVASVCHPRLASAAPPLVSRRRVPRTHGFSEGGARRSYVRTDAPRAPAAVHVRVDDEYGRLLAQTNAAVRLLTLAEWRAVVSRVPALEEAALEGGLGGPRPFLELAGDECVLVLAKRAVGHGPRADG